MIAKNKLSISDWANIGIAIVSVAALLFSVYQYMNSVNKENQINRPIVTIFQSQFGFDSVNDTYYVLINVQNFGSRPAYDLNYRVTTFSKDLATNEFKNLGVYGDHTVNPLPLNDKISINTTPVTPSSNGNIEYYLKANFDYKDAISDNYSDSLYFKWAYKKGTNTNSLRLVGLSVDEAKALENQIFLLENSK